MTSEIGRKYNAVVLERRMPSLLNQYSQSPRKDKGSHSPGGVSLQQQQRPRMERTAKLIAPNIQIENSNRHGLQKKSREKSSIEGNIIKTAKKPGSSNTFQNSK
jgi:hypothetical protein